MIRIRSEGTNLRVDVDIPGHLNGGKNQFYSTKAELGGSEIAVRALAFAMQKKLEETIQQIRKEAYQQGTRDRAMRATLFDDIIAVNRYKGGCQ